MNPEQFIQQLEKLTDEDWKQIIQDQVLVLHEDLYLQTGPSDHAQAIVKMPLQELAGVEELKHYVLQHAERILDNYYFTHALSQEGFRRQVLQLMQQHGAGKFIAVAGQRAELTLFVDGATVVAESADQPRHAYGAFCEVESPSAVTESKALEWVQQGTAYESYLAMNVCRFNC